MYTKILVPLDGTPNDEIVKYAEENDFDLIALANQERTGASRWFFGSIEEKVRRRSSLPVLFVSRRR